MDGSDPELFDNDNIEEYKNTPGVYTSLDQNLKFEYKVSNVDSLVLLFMRILRSSV